MKKLFTLMVMSFAVIALVNGQLIKNDFLDGFEAGDAIETSTTASVGEWYGVGDGESPKAVSPLSYDGYIESGKGVSTDLLKLETGSRTSHYGITTGAEYAPSEETPYYLAFMINADYYSTAADRFLLFQRAASTGDGLRVMLNTGDADTYQIGLQEPGGQTAYTTLNKNETYLIVVKIDNVKASLFVNPTLGEPEPATPSATIETVNASQLSSIKSIAVRQSNRFSAQFGGIRFTDTWAEAVKKSTLDGVRSIEKNSDLVKISGKDIITENEGKLTVYNMLGATVLHGQTMGRLTTNLPKGIYVIHFKGEDGVQLSAKMAVSF